MYLKIRGLCRMCLLRIVQFCREKLKSVCIESEVAEIIHSAFYCFVYIKQLLSEKLNISSLGAESTHKGRAIV